jgi:hypothetical protein
VRERSCPSAAIISNAKASLRDPADNKCGMIKFLLTTTIFFKRLNCDRGDPAGDLARHGRGGFLGVERVMVGTSGRERAVKGEGGWVGWEGLQGEGGTEPFLAILAQAEECKTVFVQSAACVQPAYCPQHLLTAATAAPPGCPRCVMAFRGNLDCWYASCSW